MRSSSFSVLAFVLTVSASLAGCKGADGDTCKEDDDCKTGLMCCRAGTFERGSCGVTCDTAPDSGPSIDSGPVIDSGPMIDSGPVIDSGPMSDAPVDATDAGPVDAPAMVDANDSGPDDVGVDAPTDAGPDAFDSGTPVDASSDTDPADSGPDADAA